MSVPEKSFEPGAACPLDGVRVIDMSRLVSGNMVSGLYESSWFVRLDDADQTELLAVNGAGPVEIMPGRAMAGYVALPPSIIADEPAVRAWLDRATTFGRSLPPKVAKPKPKAKTRPDRA